MSLPRAVAPLVLALAVLGACSPTPPTPAPTAAAPAAPAPTSVTLGPAAPTEEPAEASDGLCEQLDAGVIPAQALNQLPGLADDPPAVLADAAATIREDCPQHTAAADSIQYLVDSGAADAAPRNPGEAALQACVEQTGQTEDQCREQAASGGAN